jgi:hypothetical protein
MLFGGVFTLIGRVRISLFALPANRIVEGYALLLVSWFSPSVMRTLPETKNSRWTTSSLLALFLPRVLGLIFSTAGAWRVFGNRNTE